MITEAEGWAGFITRGIKRESDAGLLADLDYSRREVAEMVETKDFGLYHDTMRVKVRVLEDEKSRRERLVAFGGPAVRGLPGILERVEKVKASIDLLSVADLLGLSYPTYQLGQRVRYACPLHGDGTDRNPSGMLNLDRNTWHCFGCNVGGDIFDLLIAWRKADTFLEALKWVEAHCGIVVPRQGHSSGLDLCQ